MASVDLGEEGKAPRGGDATAPMERRAASLHRGEQVGRYVVLHPLGEGGMGIVYAAYDPQLDRRIALKVVRAEHRSERGRSIARRRLAREAQALAKLSHRNVVTVYDVGSHGEDLFVAMELVDGETLRDWLATPRPWPEVIARMLEAGRGLAAAHEVGVVHRDFKPSNVLISSRGELRVTDFGLARLEATTEIVSVGELEESARVEHHAELTKTGKVVGTPAYMAPEQHAGHPPDARADQYAFALTLYEALYGTRPFGMLGGVALAAAKLLGVRRIPASDTTSHRVPRAIRRAIARGLAPDPRQRFPAMDRLLAAIDRALRPRSRFLPAVAVLGVGVFAVGLQRVHADADERCTSAEERVAAVWSDAARDRLRAAVGDATTIGHGSTRAAALQSVMDRLDRYAEAWTGVHREACEATWHRGEQSTIALDHRMACLDRRLEALRSTVEILRDGGATLLPRGVDIVLALPGVHGCSGGTSGAVDLEPYEGASAAEARTLRQRIDRVRVRAAASQYGHAIPEAQVVVDEARSLGSEALLAEALLAQARVHDDLGEAEAAIAALRDAAVAARSGGHARAELEALVELGAVFGMRRQEPSRADFYLDRAEAVLEGLGEAPELESRLALARGRVAFVAGRDEDARVELELARDLAAQRMGPDDPSVAAAQSQLAGVLLRRGDTHGAEVLLEEALVIYERVFGPHHPRVASTLGNLGLVEAGGGRFDAAMQHMARARAIFETTFGAMHPAVATADDSLGDVLRRAGRCDEAMPHFERAIATFEGVGVAGPLLGVPLLGLGRCELARAQPAAALPLLERAWEHARADDVSPVQRGDTALALALARLGTGNRDGARPLLDAAEADFGLALDPADDRWAELAAARE
jgi:tRNA A-37 threonylcarbamoyl transferase component Bud32/tetratricopeptide (TPR) repeat protein